MSLTFNTSIFTALFQLFLTLTVTIVLNSLLRSAIHIPKRIDSKRGRTYIAIIKNAISILLFTGALYAIFVILKINILPLIASAGLIGIALSIGARPFIEDFISGFFLLTQATLSIGDYVDVGSNIVGTIEDIGFRTLTIRGSDGSLNIVPNGKVQQVKNYSRREAVMYVDFPIKGGQDLDAILKLLQQELNVLTSDKNKGYKISAQSKIWGVQNVQVPNCLLIRVVLITVPSLREEADKIYRYNVIKQFEKHKILFA